MRSSLVVAMAALLVAFTPGVAHADTYGSGVYGSDVYGSGSSSNSGGTSGTSGGSAGSSSGTAASSSPGSEPTVIQTESGLQVAINLTNGQAIPPTGYYITITPLNGQGKSFDKAEIYLDGKLVFSDAPDSTGTLRWLWDTANNPATKVKIVVFGPGSGVSTHEFTVTVTPVESQNTQTPSSGGTPSGAATSTTVWPLWLIALIGLGVLLVLLLAVWLIIRRRRQNQQLPPPPTTFTPMQ